MPIVINKHTERAVLHSTKNNTPTMTPPTYSLTNTTLQLTLLAVTYLVVAQLYT